MNALLFTSKEPRPRAEWARIFGKVLQIPAICYVCAGTETQKRLGCKYPLSGERPCKFKNFFKLCGFRAFFSKDKRHALVVQKHKSDVFFTPAVFEVAQQFAAYNDMALAIIDFSRNFDLAEPPKGKRKA